jgi:hypothetical protein
VNLRVTAETDLAVTLGWDAVHGAAGFIFTVDGAEILADGKRHFTIDGGRTSVKIGKPQDGKPHAYGVEALAVVDRGSVVVPTPPAPAPSSGWDGFWSKPAPAFTKKHVVPPATSQSDLLAKINAAVDGDYIQYVGPAISGEFAVTKNVAGVAVVDFGTTRFAGAAAHSELPSAWIHGAGGLRFLGGEIVSPGGDGILVYDAAGFDWYGFTVHDTAGQGIHLAGITKACDRVRLHGEVYNCGLDLAQDPHAEKGTGLHGFYSGGSSYPVTNGDWTLDIHDQPHGAAMQINRTRNTHIALRARNITFVATQQVGGNALQFWATSAENASTWNDTITVDYVEADHVARVVETGGMEAGSLANSRILVGRGTNLRKSPAYAIKAGGPVLVDAT